MNRKILNWRWFTDCKTLQIFIYLLLKANWKEGEVEGVTVPRGSLITSVSRIADETKLSAREVRTALKHLTDTGEIKTVSTKKFSFVEVVNYNVYRANDFTICKNLTATNKTTNTFYPENTSNEAIIWKEELAMKSWNVRDQTEKANCKRNKKHIKE